MTRKRLTDEERIAHAQAKADAVKARIEAKQAKQALVRRASALPAMIRGEEWDDVHESALRIVDEACRLGELDAGEPE